MRAIKVYCPPGVEPPLYAFIDALDGKLKAILVPAQYKAVATYAGRASYRAATGYVTTAKYIGDIVAEGIESVTYTVIYTGTPSSILQRVAAKSAEDFPVILISLVVIVLAITAAVLIWRCHKRSQEDTVYHEDFSEEEDEHEE